MSTVVVTGTQWGDEGKGKIVDYLAQKAETVVRFQGGSNAGHTVVVDGVDYKLRLMPSGILFKGSHCVIGNGVAFNPKVMLQEMDGLAERGIDLSGIRISNRAQLVLPYHCLMDQLADDARGKGKVGTTHNGIGPCYVDRDNRIGIRVCDFIDKEEFAKRLKENLAIKNRELKLLYDHEPLDYDEILAEYNGYADRLRPYVCDTIALLDEEIKAGRKILFEGAQATMLDIDYGTYPYVTASHPISGGVAIGAGVAPQKIDKVDACVVRYAGILSGIDYMAVTRLDILDSFDEIKMCVAYKYKGEILNEIPASLKVLAEVEPVYETFPGWKCDITKVRKYEDLPENAKKYLTRMAEVTGIGLGIVSVGPNRDETIVIANDIF